MKKQIITLAIIVIAALPFASFSQAVFPLSELEKMAAKNFSDFETIVLTKDYSLQGKMSNATNKVYTSDKPNANGKPNTVSRSQVPNAKANVVFSTPDKKYYLDVKAHLGTEGYKFVKEENKLTNGEQTAWNNYTNGKFQLSLYSYSKDDVVWYTVQIHL